MGKLITIFCIGTLLLPVLGAFGQMEERYVSEEIPGDFSYELVADSLSCLEQEVQ